MHFVISGTWGPTDPTRAMLPFIFAASAVQDGDTVTLMLFHDAVLMAVDGAGAKLVPVGPPNRYEEVVSHPNVILWACRPCVDAPLAVAEFVTLCGFIQPRAGLESFPWKPGEIDPVRHADRHGRPETDQRTAGAAARNPRGISGSSLSTEEARPLAVHT